MIANMKNPTKEKGVCACVYVHIHEVAHAFNSTSQEAEEGRSEFLTSPVYKATFRTAKSTQRTPVFEETTKHKIKTLTVRLPDSQGSTQHSSVAQLYCMYHTPSTH